MMLATRILHTYTYRLRRRLLCYVMLCYYVTADSCSYIFWNLLSAAFPCLQPIRGWRVALRQT